MDVFEGNSLVGPLRRGQREVDSRRAHRLGPLHSETFGPAAIEEPVRLVRSHTVGQLAGKTPWIGGPLKRLGRLMADGDVVGMTVETVPSEGQHHLGAEPAYLLDQLLHHLFRGDIDVRQRVGVGVCAGHSRVPVAQDPVPGESQGADGAGKLGPADLSQGLPGGRALLPDLPLFPGCSGHQAHLDSPGGVGRQCAANGKGLIVGVGEAYQ